MGIFKWKENCSLCGKVALKDLKHSDWDKIAEARTIKVKNNIISLWKQRNDKWAEAIKRRISGCIVFVASEVAYFPKCYKNYISMFWF